MAMYSYNGHIAPKLPEVKSSNQGNFQYASISTNGYGLYSLVMSTVPLSFCRTSGGSGVYANTSDDTCYWANFQYSNTWVFDKWEDLYANYVTKPNKSGSASNFPVWANYDMYGANSEKINYEYNYTATNTLLLEGSDAVPADITIRCPDSVLQGLFIVISCDSPKKKYIDFTCTLSGNTSQQTRLIQYNSYTARLQCAKDETAGSLTIEVVSADDPTVTASKTIAVVPHDWTYPDDEDNPGGNPGGGGWDETSTVTGISLHVYPDTVVPGGRATVEVSVNGIGNYSQAFTARLSGHSLPETELFSAGYSCNIWIDKEETAEYVLVTVASVQDPTVTATEMIYIDHSGTEEEGTTQEQLQIAFWKGFAAARAYFREAKLSASATVNIAKDAEPTTKEGKLRRAFWQGFVSALIVAAGDTIPEGVLISSDGYILCDSNGLYLIAKEDS